MAILAIDALVPLGVAAGVLYVVVIAITMWAPQERLSISMAILCSAFTVAGMWIPPPPGEIMWFAAANRVLAVAAIWVVAILTRYRHLAQRRRLRLIDELLEAQTTIKTLRGLLPICAWCKRIRDDRGDWEDIEVYVRQRTDAHFTHGVCPRCADKLTTSAPSSPAV